MAISRQINCLQDGYKKIGNSVQRTRKKIGTEIKHSALISSEGYVGISVADADSVNPDPDPAFHANPDTGFW